jgi:hypothetical protein
MKHNKAQLVLPKFTLLRERDRGKDTKMVMCQLCSGFFSAAFFSRHRKHCVGESSVAPNPVPVSLLTPICENLNKEFKDEILQNFRDDAVGQLCRSDSTIILVGSRLYEKMKRKQDKLNEVKKSVRTDMRRIAGLYMCFQKSSAEESTTSAEMLVRRHFHVLERAIEEYTSGGESGLKPGLKLSLFYLIKKMAKIVKASYLVKNLDNEAAEVDRFLEVLALNESIIFGDAIYAINKGRQTKLRRPEQLPGDDDVQTLRDYTVNSMSKLINDQYLLWTSKEFVCLRDLAVSRLTLFNARRGGEPARLLITDWKDAELGAWIDNSAVKKLHEVEQKLFRDMRVTYQTGKGNNHLVPVIIPNDTVCALRKLCDDKIRADVGILETNRYIFPCTQLSMEHVSGWHAVNKICLDANVREPNRLTATKMRHRASTLYAAMDVPECERLHFYKHMGHSSDINANVYQAPLAVMEITKVGVRLQEMDQLGIPF